MANLPVENAHSRGNAALVGLRPERLAVGRSNLGAPGRRARTMCANRSPTSTWRDLVVLAIVYGVCSGSWIRRL